MSDPAQLESAQRDFAEMPENAPEEPLGEDSENCQRFEKKFAHTDNKSHNIYRMTKTTYQTVPVPSSPEVVRSRRSRHFQRPGRMLVVALLLSASFLAFSVFVAGSVSLIVSDHRLSGIAALIGLGVFGITRLMAFVLSRSLTCPLCHGPVMHEKRCHKHSEAQRLPLMGYRGTVVLAVLFTLGFRCMYCGTPYRLRK